MENIVLVGFGGHAISVADSMEGKYKIIGYTDYEKHESKYPYLGTDDILEEYYELGVKNAFVTIGFMGNTFIRNRLYEKLKEIGYYIPVIIDPTAIIASDVMIEEGSYIGKRAVVNSQANIGKMCIINTGAIIEHECKIGNFSHVAVGTVVCGQAEIGENTLIGANSTILQQRKIGDSVIIGAGCVVKRNVEDNNIVKG